MYIIDIVDGEELVEIGELKNFDPVPRGRKMLERRRELDLTEHFGKFYCEISAVAANVAQLVQHRGTVVGAICRNLRRGGMAAVPLLTLLPSLALDLQVSARRSKAAHFLVR